MVGVGAFIARSLPAASAASRLLAPSVAFGSAHLFCCCCVSFGSGADVETAAAGVRRRRQKATSSPRWRRRRPTDSVEPIDDWSNGTRKSSTLFLQRLPFSHRLSLRSCRAGRRNASINQHNKYANTATHKQSTMALESIRCRGLIMECRRIDNVWERICSAAMGWHERSAAKNRRPADFPEPSLHRETLGLGAVGADEDAVERNRRPAATRRRRRERDLWQ